MTLTAYTAHTAHEPTSPTTGNNPVTDPADAAPNVTVVIELTPNQVAQHPDNLRDARRGIRELTTSVSEVGVLVPLIVVPVQAVPGHDFEPGVTHVAVDGNRRQAAARAAGLPLPCIVRPGLASARDTALTMAVTGLARDALTAREEAGAVQTMLDLGIDAAVIGRATGRSRKHIAAARKAAALPVEIVAAVGDYPMTLADLAALAELHDPDATTALLGAIPRGQLDHVLARLTLAQRERKLRAKAVRDLTRQGVTVVDDEPNYHGDGPRVLTRLRAADAPTGQALAPDEHVDCPGHIAYVEVSIYEVDPDDGTDEESEVSVTYGCADPAAYGHLDLWDRPGVRTVPLPDEDVPPDADEQARAERQARDARRELIRLNKEAPVDCTSVGAFVGLGAGRRRTLCWEVVPWIRCPLRAMSRCSVFQRSAGSTGLAGVRGRCWARTASRCWRGQVSGASWWPAGVPPRRAVPMPTTFCGGCVSLPRWALRGSRPAGSRCATTCGGCALRPIRPATGAQRRVAGHRPGR